MVLHVLSTCAYQNVQVEEQAGELAPQQRIEQEAHSTVLHQFLHCDAAFESGRPLHQDEVGAL